MAQHRVLASFWLRVSEPERSELRKLIRRLALARGTPDFEPHLTLCGGVGRHPTSWKLAAEYVRHTDLLPLRVKTKRLSWSVGFAFKAVFIEVADSAPLSRLRNDLRDITHADSLDAPHISLLYSLNNYGEFIPFDDSALRAIAGQCARIRDEYTLERPVIVSPGQSWNTVADWRTIWDMLGPDPGRGRAP